jgi:hypothetical protein
MPIRITNDQSKIAGEMLAMSSAINGTKMLNTTFSDVATLQVQFEADRSNNVRLIYRGFVTNSCSSNTKVDVSMRLVNDLNQPVANTTMIVHTFAKPGSTVGNGIAQLVQCQWVVSVTDGTSYTYKLQAKRSTTTNSIVIDYTDQITTLDAIGE